MTDLKCIVRNCIYNKDDLCSKGDILVGGKHAKTIDETCCESFAEKREGLDAFVSSIAHPSKNISIDCEAAECIHNEDFRCAADHVDIKGCSACSCRDTACATFSDK